MPSLFDLIVTGLSVAFALVAIFVAQLGTPVSQVITIVLLAVAIVLFLLCRLGIHVVHTKQGLALVYNRVTTTRKEPMRVLRQGGVYQSATYNAARWCDPVFAYHRAFDVLFDANESFDMRTGHPITRILALGGGGYAWPKHALMANPEITMDVVEIDPAITDAAWRWFYLDELARKVGKVDGPVDPQSAHDGHEELRAMLGMPTRKRLGLITADGRAYIERTDLAPYDAVVNDTFVGAEPAMSLATAEAALAVKKQLVADGLYLMNVVSCDGGRDVSFLRNEVATLLSVFAHVTIIPAADAELGAEDNYLVIASDTAYEFSDAISYDEEFLGTVLRDEC